MSALTGWRQSHYAYYSHAKKTYKFSRESSVRCSLGTRSGTAGEVTKTDPSIPASSKHWSRLLAQYEIYFSEPSVSPTSPSSQEPSDLTRLNQIPAVMGFRYRHIWCTKRAKYRIGFLYFLQFSWYSEELFNSFKQRWTKLRCFRHCQPVNNGEIY